VHHGRTKLATALTGLALAATIGIIPSTSAQAAPDVATVQKQVDTLFRQAEEASERVNDAKLELTDLRRDLRALQADQDRQHDTLGGVREQVQDSIISQYTGADLSAVGKAVTSDDPSAFVTGMSTMSAYNEVQSDLFDSYATELKALNIRSEATAARATEVEQTRQAMAEDKATIDAKLADAQAQLDKLKAAEREAVLGAGGAAAPSDVPASGRAGAAISYAMAQVGDAYVYGAAGESAFDCSGLTMRAWAQAGVSLPHSSSAQFSSGPRVAESDLRPGDLVFYYSPISHVGMYIGNGLIVNALNPGAGVRVSELHSMPYVGAVRPG
jgi:cell wall-associated NlpC family hydrolase